jgi:ABC-type bacteriocin/lantibiotic exporter with double-glycine peptidase domain
VAGALCIAVVSLATFDFQLEDSGLHCLFVALEALDASPGSLVQLERDLGSRPRTGYSLSQLQAVAQSRGLHAMMVATTVAQLRSRRDAFVCITQLNNQRMVFVSDVRPDRSEITVLDPPRRTTLSSAAFATQWSGQSLLLSRTPLADEVVASPSSRGWATLCGGLMGVVLVSLLAWRLVATVRGRYT